MAGAIRPITLISVARNEMASGSRVVERISSPTRERTSWAGIPSRTRSRKAWKKYACSMYSSRSRTGMGRLTPFRGATSGPARLYTKPRRAGQGPGGPTSRRGAGSRPGQRDPGRGGRLADVLHHRPHRGDVHAVDPVLVLVHAPERPGDPRVAAGELVHQP